METLTKTKLEKALETITPVVKEDVIETFGLDFMVEFYRKHPCDKFLEAKISRKTPCIRHGDVILISLEHAKDKIHTAKFNNIVKSDSPMLQIGKTNNDHMMVGNFTIYDNLDRETNSFGSQIGEKKLVCHNTCLLVHREHGNVIVPKGTYEVRYQQTMYRKRVID